ncbi:MAG: hypothetical protein K2G93_01445 [Rikenella sp.]|nr:hypothetical protein [Rikenella sp.]
MLPLPMVFALNKPGRSVLRRFLFYPAPGVRHASYGTLYSVGSVGYSWASSCTETAADNLYFNADGIAPNTTTSRANGRQPRCLQE